MGLNNSNQIAAQLVEKTNESHQQLATNMHWLQTEMSPYFLRLNQDETNALSLLALNLQNMEASDRLTLVDRKERLMLAQIDKKGSLYHTLHDLPERNISYLEITTSFSKLPASDKHLEVMRCDFNLNDENEKAHAPVGEIPSSLSAEIIAEMKALDNGYPNF